MILSDLEDLLDFIEHAKSIPGLTVIGDGEDHEMCALGWNCQAVSEALNSARQRIERNGRLGFKKEGTGKMKEHAEYIESLGDISGEPFELYQTTGTYYVRCKDIESQWDHTNDMSMHISEGTERLFVDFNFGILKGVMLMARSQIALRRLVCEFGRLEVARLVESEPFEVYSEEEVTDGEDGGTSEGGKKRKAAQGTHTAHTNKKHKKTEPSGPPFRLYLQWRGRETREGEIQLDPDNTNIGHIDFVDTACTRFEGEANLGFIGGAVSFTGYKISELSGRWGPFSPQWDRYSEVAYREERNNR